MRRLLFLVVALLALPAWGEPHTVRVKDVVDVAGVRENELYGYGLVVGLAGTGDTQLTLFTAQSVAGMLGRLGVRVDPTALQVRNVAAVMVTARLPTFARPGTPLDVSVASLGDAKSLLGGVLVVTPLSGADGQVYALAQGAVQVGGYSAGSAGSSVQKNAATSARVPNGATIERAVTPDLSAQPLVFELRHPDFATASHLAAAINTKLGTGTARALDRAAVQITPPEARKADLVGLVAEIEALEFEADARAKVVVSERTGTVVAGEGVRLRPATVAHGSLQISISRKPVVSQPNPNSVGKTVVAEEAKVEAKEQHGSVMALEGASTVGDLAKALNQLGANPRDLISVLQALSAAGSLDADLEVI